MKNWKTTVGGMLATVGMSLQLSNDPTMHTIGVVVAGLGTLLLGASAKDNNVTGGTVQQ